MLCQRVPPACYKIMKGLLNIVFFAQDISGVILYRIGTPFSAAEKDSLASLDIDFKEISWSASQLQNALEVDSLEAGSLQPNFFDEDEVRSVYYQETEALIQAHSGGAERVLVFDHTLRTAEQARQQADRVRKAVYSVHNDYTERSAPQRIRDFLPEAEAEAALKRRFAIIQTWRSIAPRVERDPLALCDGRTIPEEGFIPYERRYRYRTGETYHISYNPAHRWFWFPHMTRDEALVFKVFDTDASAGVRFTAHTAFDDPNTPPDAAIRESIEMRALVLY